MPPKTTNAKVKFAPVLTAGIFLGPHLGNGCKPDGSYYCLELSDYEKGKNMPAIHRIKELVHDSGDGIFKFPVRDALELG